MNWDSMFNYVPYIESNHKNDICLQLSSLMITMKLHHIGIVVQDIENGIQRYKSMFGFIPITEVINDPIQKVSVVLLSNPELDSLPIDARAHFQFTIKTD